MVTNFSFMKQLSERNGSEEGILKLVFENIGLIDKDALLRKAMSKGWEKVAQFAIDQGANVNYRAKMSRTPLHLAAYTNQISMVQLLLKAKADVNSHDFVGLTPLHLAVRRNYTEIAQLLIENGAQIDSGTLLHDTPLHCAVFNNHLEMAQLLLKYGAKADLKGDEGLTPGELANKKFPNDALWINTFFTLFFIHNESETIVDHLDSTAVWKLNVKTVRARALLVNPSLDEKKVLLAHYKDYSFWRLPDTAEPHAPINQFNPSLPNLLPQGGEGI